MNKKRCLNCGHSVSDEYCAHCGQKSDTARITPVLFIKNDVLGSIWHVEARFLNTLKEILIRPGITATNYISGKRIRYYNFISLLLILFGFNVIAFHLFINTAKIDLQAENSKTIDFFSKYSKATLLFLIPVLACNAWIVFRKIKFNLAEHFVIATVSLIGILVFFLPMISSVSWELTSLFQEFLMVLTGFWKLHLFSFLHLLTLMHSGKIIHGQGLPGDFLYFIY